MMLPAQATLISTWNVFSGPLIYPYEDRRQRCRWGLAMFTGQYGSLRDQPLAVSTVMTAPIVALFFFTRRAFSQGATMTPMRG
ncbi:MAG TPA: hypothetical protein VLH79_13255 [Chthonomonadales bacterium]|nr:hypothetical protein [Chthonomonadales bacterium]